MLHRIAFLSAAACAFALAALPRPAAAADYYDGGRGPAVFHGEEAPEFDGDRPAVGHRRDFGPGRWRAAPGPVVFDERDGRRRYEGGDPDFGAGGRYPGPGGPGPFDRPAFGYGPRFGGPPPGPYGFGAPPSPRYRAVAVPGDREAYDEGTGGPDVGCTVQEAQSTTPAGWRKTVTHRTCYRR